VISALAYLFRFALLPGVEAALFYWVARNTCRPLADLSTEETFGGAIPPEATCYTRDHGVISFHDFHALAEDPIPAILTAGLLLCFLGLFFWRGFWVGGRGGTAPDAAPDPFAASRATTLSQLAMVFWQRFGAGPVVLACAAVAFSLATIAPPFAAYRGLIPLVVIAAGGAMLIGKPRGLEKRSGKRTPQ
jgi:hypothetical protein